MPAAIVAIETIPLRIPVKPGLPGPALWGEPLTAADTLLVKVTQRKLHVFGAYRVGAGPGGR